MHMTIFAKFVRTCDGVVRCQIPRSLHTTAINNTSTDSPRQKSMSSSHHWKGPTTDAKERMNRLKNGVLETRVYSGTRILEFTEENAGELSTSLIFALINKLKDLQDNKSVESVIFVGDSKSFIQRYDADGVSNLDSKLELMRSCHELSKHISSLNKNTIAVYSGKFNGTAYGIFSSCKYRVGTPSSTFSITDLLHGTLPFGGTAFKISNCSTGYGVEIGRYLAATCSCLGVIDMLHLGLLSYYTAEQVEDTLSVSFQHTNHEFDDSKCYQPSPVRSESIEGLLEDTHFSSDVDPLNDQIFDQMMLVHPKETTKLADGIWKGCLVEDIDSIHTAFSAESVRETKNRLKNMRSKWASTALNRMEMIDEHLLQKWFELTRYSAEPNCTLEDVYEKERLLTSLP